jgi:hydroxypyruvate isomerase
MGSRENFRLVDAVVMNMALQGSQADIMPRFAANLGYMFTERPLIERFGAAAACGFGAVEGQFPYDTPASAVRTELERHRLTMLGINTPPGREGEFGVAALPGRERDFDELFKRALDYIVTAGGRAIHVLAGRLPPEQRPAAERTFVSNLTRAADLAAEKNITLLIEPINPRDRPDYFLNRPEHAAEIIGKVGKPNVRIQFDFYHVQIVGGDLIRRFEKHQPLAGHVQIASVPDRHEPDEGEVNYPAIFRMLDERGYDGFVACEYRPRGRTEDGLGWGRDFGIGAS